MSAENSAPSDASLDAGWYPDPLGRFDNRYFNGTQWTPDVARTGVQTVDPLGVATGHPGPTATTPHFLACGYCRRSPAARVTIHQGIGLLVLHRHKYAKGPMCRDCGLTQYKALQGKTLVTGWWGIISFFANVVYIGMNFSAAAKLKKLPAPQ